MASTWGQLVSEITANIWPTGEQPELVPAHAKAFVDAMSDLQKFVPCLQQDQTSLFPACSTYYRCGLSMFTAPRGRIKKVSVIVTPAGSLSPNYCAEVEYHQVAFKDMELWLRRLGEGALGGMGFPFAAFFGLDSYSCRKPIAPVPTDEGLPAGLPPLPLGVHYAQGSTDRPHYRSRAGVWAIERGTIYIAPWLNTVNHPETVIVKWDGIKRTWGANDPIDADPDLASALEEYVRCDHARKFDRDFTVSEVAGEAYKDMLAKLMRECREENRVRDREPSYARPATVLYYNDTAYTANATATSSDCPSGQTAQGTTSGTATVPVGSVGSSISVADANAQAQAQAQQQAKANAVSLLVCTGGVITPGGCAGFKFCNDTGYTQQAQPQCASGQTGTVQSATVAVGTVGSNVSVADANAQAQALAQSNAQAAANGTCTASTPTGPKVWNTEQPNVIVSCPAGSSGNTVTMAVPAHRVGVVAASSSAEDIALAQDQANTNAIALVTAQANAALKCSTCNPETQVEVVVAWAGTPPHIPVRRVATIPAGTICSPYGIAVVNALMGLFTQAMNMPNPQIHSDIASTTPGVSTASLPAAFNGVAGAATVIVTVTVPVGVVTGSTVGVANGSAQTIAQQLASTIAAAIVPAQAGNNTYTFRWGGTAGWSGGLEELT